MRKNYFMLIIMILICGIFNTACFATEITFSCDTMTSLTKNIILTVSSEITVDWGDSNIEEFNGSCNIIHTYSNSGVYNISITSDEIFGFEATGNDIISLNVSNVPELQELIVDSNKLEQLDLSNNSSLVEINCADNYIQSLNLDSTALKSLDVSGNRIEDINDLEAFDVSNFTNLEVLNVRDNRISNLIVTGCSALEELDLSNNYIESISFSNNSMLKNVYCSGNDILALDFSSNSSIQNLDCSGNGIETLDISNCVNLQEINALQNEIAELDLNNLSISFVAVDEAVNVLNGNSVTTLLKIKVVGNSGVHLGLDKTLYFGDMPNKVFVNGSELGTVGTELSVSGYTGVVEIEVAFNDDLDSNVLVNSPQLTEGMIPVKYDGKNWVVVSPLDSEWYNYSSGSMKWANAMLRDDAKYLDFDGVTLKNIGTTSLDELIGKEIPQNYTGSMYVWIPRYSYKVTDSGVDINYSDGVDDYIEDGYKAHPAFSYAHYTGGDASNESSYHDMDESDRLMGIWVAKYPAGQNIANPKYASGIQTISDSSIGEAFSASKLVGTSNNKYGMTSGSGHMMKNAEWGAVAYLTTGKGKLENNSTTGNIYGIYGMQEDGEYVANFIELIGGISNYSVRSNGTSLIPYKMITYKDREEADEKDIEILRLKTHIDSSDSNYSVLSGFYGIGINEISSNITGNVTKDMPFGDNAFFVRGIDGIYSYAGSNGAKNSGYSFRNVIVGGSPKESVNTYTITSSAKGKGTISPLGTTTIEDGGNITYALRPNSGYEVIDVIVDGRSVYYSAEFSNYDSYATYTFSDVKDDHEISVKFDSKIADYNVSVEKFPENSGEIEGEGTYKSRSSVTLRAKDSNGYRFSYWEKDDSLNEAIDTSSSEISFTMPSNNVVLKAYFEKILKAMLTINTGSSKAYGEESVGESVKIVAEIKDGYSFYGWVVDGIELDDSNKKNKTLEFVMPSTDVEITAVYSLLSEVATSLGDGTTVSVEQEERETVVMVAPEQLNGKTFSRWVTSELQDKVEDGNRLSFTMSDNVVMITAEYE